MATKVVTILLLLVAVGLGYKTKPSEYTEESAKIRLYKDFVKTLYSDIGVAQADLAYKMVQLYTHDTIQQVQEVSNYIQQHCNKTRWDSNMLRAAANSSAEIADCIQKGEISIIHAYKATSHNVENCIRPAQQSHETAFAQIHTKLDHLKGKALAVYREYANLVENCSDSECIMKILIAAIVRYESMKQELSVEKDGGDYLMSRYIVNNVAMGCVKSALEQIHNNYEIGKSIMTRCFHGNKPEVTHHNNNRPETVHHNNNNNRPERTQIHNNNNRPEGHYHNNNNENKGEAADLLSHRQARMEHHPW